MRRRSRRSAGARLRLTLLLLLAAALAVALVRTGVLDGGPGEGGSPAAPVALEADLSAAQRAQVLDVVDGDTIDVAIDGRQERVRYYGVNTPERGERCYREAIQRNRELAAGEVLLLPDQRDRDRSGRLLRYVFTPDGRSVDAALVSEGLAWAWTEDGTYREALGQLQAEAEAAKRGCLWAE